MKKTLKILLGLIITGLLIRYAAAVEEYIRVLADLSWLVLIFAFAIGTLDRVVMAWKWNKLLGIVCRMLPLIRSVQIYCTSQLYGLFLPATIGADAIRVTLSMGEGRKAPSVTASIVLERALGLLATLCASLAALVFSGFSDIDRLAFNSTIVAILTLLSIISVLLTFSMSDNAYKLVNRIIFERYPRNKLISIVHKVHDSYCQFRGSNKTLVLFFLSTIFEIMSGTLFVFIIIRALGETPNFFAVLVAFNLASLLGRIPISFSGLGIFEAGFVYFLSLFGVSPEVSVLAALLSRILQVIIWLPWWLSYSVARPLRVIEFEENV